MAAATVLANIPKAKCADILEQSCVAQTVTVGSDAILYWPLIISLIANLLLAIVILRLVLKREKEINIVYANTVAQDAEASDEHPPDPSPRVESPRAHRSSSAQLSSSSPGLSAEADEATAPLGEAGSRDENTTGQDPVEALATLRPQLPLQTTTRLVTLILMIRPRRWSI